MPHPHLCRSLLFPVAQYIVVSLSISLCFSFTRTYTRARARVCISVSSPYITTNLFSLYLSFSISLCFLNVISLYFCLTSVLSTWLFRFFVPSLPVQLVPPSCFNTPTCHVAVWVHVYVVAHSGARPTAAATECGCGVPTELRVRTTVPRTHHSVPHSCLTFSCDRLPAGILSPIHPIDRSIDPATPLFFKAALVSSAIVSGRSLITARQRREFKDNRDCSILLVHEMKAGSREDPIVERSQGERKGRGQPSMRYEMYSVSTACLWSLAERRDSFGMFKVAECLPMDVVGSREDGPAHGRWREGRVGIRLTVGLWRREFLLFLWPCVRERFLRLSHCELDI